MIGTFAKEADLCAAFIETLPKGWTVYPETAGFDMVLLHDATGTQIGVEAKLRLNAKVILQAADRFSRYHHPGPDFRAVLVPHTSELAAVCALLGLTVLVVSKVERHVTQYDANRGKAFFSWPKLPTVERLDHWLGDRVSWYDQAPIDRLALPEYVPQVECGVPAPMTLSNWKIKAIKVCVWVERTGSITRDHFRAMKIDPGRWMTGHWLKMGSARGTWIAGPSFPAASYRKHHGLTYTQIEADFDRWSAEAKLVLPPEKPVQEVLI